MAKLLIIDPYFGEKSPSMKSCYRALSTAGQLSPHTDIEVWCHEAEENSPSNNTKFFWKPPVPSFIQAVVFFIQVHYRFIIDFYVLRKERPSIVQTTDYFCFFADVIYIHFCYKRYLEISIKYKDIIALSFVRSYILRFNVLMEKLMFLFAKPREYWTVSYSMRKVLSGYYGIEAVRVVPNSYDESRFNREARSVNRQAVRSEFGFKSDDLVIGFSSLGGFERKGLSLVLKVLERLIDQGIPVKLLLVGGAERDLTAEVEKYSVSEINWDNVLTTGRVDNPEYFFSAFDCFLFPSYCESFCLVLIEALEMGIRIYPSEFDGHEMSLREGDNGRLVPWDVDGIVKILSEDFHTGKLFTVEKGGHNVPDKEEFRRTLFKLHTRLLNTK